MKFLGTFNLAKNHSLFIIIITIAFITIIIIIIIIIIFVIKSKSSSIHGEWKKLFTLDIEARTSMYLFNTPVLLLLKNNSCSLSLSLSPYVFCNSVAVLLLCVFFQSLCPLSLSLSCYVFIYTYMESTTCVFLYHKTTHGPASSVA